MSTDVRRRGRRGALGQGAWPWGRQDHPRTCSAIWRARRRVRGRGAGLGGRGGWGRAGQIAWCCRGCIHGFTCRWGCFRSRPACWQQGRCCATGLGGAKVQRRSWQACCYWPDWERKSFGHGRKPEPAFLRLRENSGDQPGLALCCQHADVPSPSVRVWSCGPRQPLPEGPPARRRRRAHHGGRHARRSRGRLWLCPSDHAQHRCPARRGVRFERGLRAGPAHVVFHCLAHDWQVLPDAGAPGPAEASTKPWR